MSSPVLLFDLGGVLVDFDGLDGLRALLPAPMADADLLARWTRDPLSLAYGAGQIDTDAFMAAFVDDWQLSVEPLAFRVSWDSWVKGWLPGAEALVAELATRHRVAALSNSNAAHWDRLDALGILAAFEPAMGSHELGLRKPDAAIFAAALARLDVAPSDVLFFDDSRANVEAARACGLDAVWVEGPDAVRRHLAHA